MSNAPFRGENGGGRSIRTSGDFVFEVSEAYRIENGNMTAPVKNASLIGNGAETLSNVFAPSGNDLGFAIGPAAKADRAFPSVTPRPTLGIFGLVVGGKG